MEIILRFLPGATLGANDREQREERELVKENDPDLQDGPRMQLSVEFYPYPSHRLKCHRDLVCKVLTVKKKMHFDEWVSEWVVSGEWEWVSVSE